MICSIFWSIKCDVAICFVFIFTFKIIRHKTNLNCAVNDSLVSIFFAGDLIFKASLVIVDLVPVQADSLVCFRACAVQ